MALGLQALSFVLLTHRHKDHLDLGLIRELRDLPIRWVVPEDLLPLIETQSELPLQRVIVPEHGKAFELEGLRITPFDGLHWEPAGTLREDGQAALRGVPATGYLVECGSKRWLFPGDTRRYEAQRLPSFGPVDVLFAHVWLGRAGALEAQPPLLEPFCRFCLDLQPRHILLTHLHEFGRAPEDYWDEEHAARALSRLGELAPDLPVQTLVTGQGVTL
jgi:L-ascorbate metabolism protein UlaG (beta-lactamase superfamily)